MKRNWDRVTWVPRGDDGRQLVQTVGAELPGREDAYYWVAAEAGSTRAIARHVRRVLGVDKQRLSSLGYWSGS